MMRLIDSPAFAGFCERALAVLADSAAKGVILLALAWLIALGLRRSSAAARHLVWSLALGGLLLLPALSLVLPKWQLPILPRTPLLARPAPAVMNLPIPAIPQADRLQAVAPAAHQASPSALPFDHSPTLAATRAGTPPAAPSATPAATQPQRPVQPLPLAFWLITVWLSVALAALVPLCAGLIFLCRLIRQSTPLEHDPWPALLRSLAERLGLRRPVQLLRTNGATMPMAVGVLQPTVLLPAEAEAWSDEKRRAVLLHELAHIRRWDCLTHILTRLACVAHWFNPLAWLALKRLQNERERACDDLVLVSGARPAAYAEELLDIARTMRAGAAASTAAIPMARQSQLEGRLLAILEKKCNRKSLSRKMFFVSIGLTICVVLSIGALQPVRADQKGRPDVEQLIRENQQVMQITGPVDQIKPGLTIETTGHIKLLGLNYETQHRVYQVSGKQGSAEVTVDLKKRFGRWNNAINVKPCSNDRSPNASPSQTSETTLRGIILTPDGKPAEGAEVALCEPGSRGFSLFEFIGNKDARRSEQYKSSAQVITTQADGKYEFTSHAKCYGLVARHSSGVTIESEETLPQDGKVTLHPWGRVEGVLKEGNKVIPNHELQITFDTPRKKPMTSGNINEFPRITFNYTATTDGQGRFVIDRIHAGAARIGARMDLEGGTWTFSPMMPIEIKPQGTTVFNLGGMGRAVTGQVTLKAGSDPKYNLADCEVALQPFMPRPPAAVMKGDRDAYEKWRAEWEQTADGKAYKALQGYYRRVHPDQDGRFRFIDIPEGKYSVSIVAYEMRDLNLPSGTRGGLRRVPGDILGVMMGQEFEIPPMPGGRSDEPFDVGKLEVLAAKVPKAGEEAPDFKCATFGGKELSLKDYRGKFVLLSFWAGRSGAIPDEALEHKKIWAGYGKRPDFAMIGLNVGDDMEAAEQVIKENKLEWEQAYLGHLESSPVAKKYGVLGLPMVILIGPDGRIIERNLRGTQLSAAVGRALAASAPRPAAVKATSSTQAVQVQVVDEAGHPVAGAVITPTGLRMKTDMVSHISWVPSRYGQPTPAKTDAQGIAWVSYPRYAEEKSETGAITFKVTHPEFCPASSDYPVDGSGQAVTMLKGATLTLSGHLPNGDQIKQDLYPVVTGGSGGVGRDACQRQPDGSFIIQQLEPGSHYVRLVRLPEQGREPIAFSEAVLLRAEKGKAYTYDLELKPGVRLEGRLDASVPRPVKNGSVIVNAYPATMDDETPYGTPDSPGDLEWRARQPVASDGSFVFTSLPPGKVEIIASCDGYVSKSPEGEEWKGSFAYPQRFKLGAPAQQVELAMEPAATAEVTVLDDQGRPLPGARVSFSPNVHWLRRGAGIFMTSHITEDFLRRPEEEKRQWQSAPYPFEATTDKSGVATVSNLPPRAGQTYNVTHPKFAMPARTVFRDVKRRSGNIDLTPGQTVKISVKMEKKGSPAPAGASATPPRKRSNPQTRKTVAAPPAPAMAPDPTDPNASPAERLARQRELIMRRMGERVAK